MVFINIFYFLYIFIYIPATTNKPPFSGFAFDENHLMLVMILFLLKMNYIYMISIRTANIKEIHNTLYARTVPVGEQQNSGFRLISAILCLFAVPLFLSHAVFVLCADL